LGAAYDFGAMARKDQPDMPALRASKLVNRIRYINMTTLTGLKTWSSVELSQVRKMVYPSPDLRWLDI
jgi:hypothetical protein